MKIAILFCALFFGQIHFWEMVGWDPLTPILNLMDALPPPDDLYIVQGVTQMTGDFDSAFLLSFVAEMDASDVLPILAYLVLMHLAFIAMLAVPLLGIGVVKWITLIRETEQSHQPAPENPPSHSSAGPLRE